MVRLGFNGVISLLGRGVLSPAPFITPPLSGPYLVPADKLVSLLQGLASHLHHCLMHFDQRGIKLGPW